MTTHSQHHERGLVSSEAIIVVPVLLLVIGALIAGGRIALAQMAVSGAAGAAARAASIERTGWAAQRAAQQVARSELAGTPCAPQISITGNFAAPAGTPSAVQATVRCTVSLADIAVPGLPGSKTYVATKTSVIDSYRERGR